MLTPNDIANRLELLVGSKFPGEKIYRELVPVEFERPSNLIVQESCEGFVDFGCAVVELQVKFKLTTFVQVDEYHHSHLQELHLRQMQLVGLFLPGYIEVGGRAPKVTELTMAGGYDYDTVTITFSYVLDRGDFMTIEQRPMMEQLHMNRSD